MYIYVSLELEPSICYINCILKTMAIFLLVFKNVIPWSLTFIEKSDVSLTLLL